MAFKSMPCGKYLFLQQKQHIAKAFYSFVGTAVLQNIWRSRRVRSQIESGARTTNGTHKVNQRLLSSIVFPVPPEDLQRRFTAVVESMEEQKAYQSAHLAELDTLFASLQSRAFRGDL